MSTPQFLNVRPTSLDLSMNGRPSRKGRLRGFGSAGETVCAVRVQDGPRGIEEKGRIKR